MLPSYLFHKFCFCFVFCEKCYRLIYFISFVFVLFSVRNVTVFIFVERREDDVKLMLVLAEVVDELGLVDVAALVHVRLPEKVLKMKIK
jgi:hypothetical protein